MAVVSVASATGKPLRVSAGRSVTFLPNSPFLYAAVAAGDWFLFTHQVNYYVRNHIAYEQSHSQFNRIRKTSAASRESVRRARGSRCRRCACLCGRLYRSSADGCTGASAVLFATTTSTTSTTTSATTTGGLRRVCIPHGNSGHHRTWSGCDACMGDPQRNVYHH